MNEAHTMPEPLSLYELHSPAEQRIHAAQVAAYFDVKREEEAAQRRKQDAAAAAAERVLTDEEYYALSVRLHEAAKAKEAARQAAEQAKKDEEAAYLASLPEVAEVSAQSEYLFLLKCQHWMAQGYFVAEDSISHFVRGCYAVRLHKPSSAKGSKQ